MGHWLDFNAWVNDLQVVSTNSRPMYKHARAMFCIVTNSFPSSSANEACYHDRFQIKLDILYKYASATQKAALSVSCDPWMINVNNLF
jgi:hypothetical protein